MASATGRRATMCKRSRSLASIRLATSSPSHLVPTRRSSDRSPIERQQSGPIILGIRRTDGRMDADAHILRHPPFPPFGCLCLSFSFLPSLCSLSSSHLPRRSLETCRIQNCSLAFFVVAFRRLATAAATAMTEPRQVVRTVRGTSCRTVDSRAADRPPFPASPRRLKR